MLTIVTRVAGALLALLGLGAHRRRRLVRDPAGDLRDGRVPGATRHRRPRAHPSRRAQPGRRGRRRHRHPAAGGSVWMALANPSDATAVLGDGAATSTVTGVDVRDWAAADRGGRERRGRRARGGGPVAPAGRGRGPRHAHGAQESAPETLVVATDGAPLRDSSPVTVTDKTWFVEAVIAALVGLFLLVAGVTLLFSRRRAVGTGRPRSSRRRRRLRPARPAPRLRRQVPRRRPRRRGGDPMSDRRRHLTPSGEPAIGRRSAAPWGSSRAPSRALLTGCGAQDAQDALVGLQRGARRADRVRAARPRGCDGDRRPARSRRPRRPSKGDAKAAAKARAAVLAGDALTVANAEAARAPAGDGPELAAPSPSPPSSRSRPGRAWPRAILARDARRGHQHPVPPRHDVAEARGALPDRRQRADVRWRHAPRAG